MTDVVGFIGAGQLGEPMVHRLLNEGHGVLAYTRRRDVAGRLAEHGATLAESVAELAGRSDILISCLFSDAQLLETGLGPDGFIVNAKPGSVFVSHTTGTLSTLTTLGDTYPTAPVVLDAPVSGTADDVAEGTLTVLIGGPSDAVDTVTPVLGAYGKPIIPTGELGSALTIKLLNNLLFAANAQLLAATTSLGDRLGVDPAVLLSALQVCSGGSYVTAHAERIGGIDRFTELAGPFLRKDLAACVEAVAERGADLGLLGTVTNSGPLDLSSADKTATASPVAE
jgi:3-hydroxyisobutyrate dehydrogenase-like beta-hydroxyacid dehydrogenase